MTNSNVFKIYNMIHIQIVIEKFTFINYENQLELVTKNLEDQEC